MSNLAMIIEEILNEGPKKQAEFKILDAAICKGLMSQDEYLLFKNNEVRIDSAESSVF